MVEKQVENVTKEIDSKIQLRKEEEDPFENVKKEKEEEATVVKTKTAEELGMENLVKDNDLVSKDVTWEEMGVKKEIIEADSKREHTGHSRY